MAGDIANKSPTLLSSVGRMLADRSSAASLWSKSVLHDSGVGKS